MARERITRRAAIKTGAVLSTAGLAGCLDALGGDDTHELRYTTIVAESHTMSHYGRNFIDKVEERTDGDIEIEIFYSDTLGDASEQLEGTSAGSIDMGNNAWGQFEAFFSEISIFDLPYIYRDYEHGIRSGIPEFSPVAEEMNERLVEDGNIRLLACNCVGPRHVAATQRACTHEEMGELSIRTIPSDVWIAMVEGMGAEAVSMPLPEIAEALETGRINGTELSASTVVDSGLMEMVDYFMLTEHIFQTGPVYINNDVWEDLTDEQQEIVEEAAVEEALDHPEFTLEDDEELIEEMEEAGVEIVEPEPDGCLEQEDIRERTLDHVTEQFADWEDDIERIRDV